MSNAFVTIIAPLDLDRVEEAEISIAALGNPARKDIRAALDKHEDAERGTHFASMHALQSCDGRRAYIVFEFSADGADEEALARIERQIGQHLRPVFMHARDWKDGGELLAYLCRHRVVPGNGWFGSPGQVFAGTPGLTVGRIWREAKLGARVAALLSQQQRGPDALKRVEEVRKQLANDAQFGDALTPAAPTQPFVASGVAEFAVQLAVSFAKTYLWPVDRKSVV